MLNDNVQLISGDAMEQDKMKNKSLRKNVFFSLYHPFGIKFVKGIDVQFLKY